VPVQQWFWLCSFNAFLILFRRRMWREHSRSLSAPALRISRCLLHTTRVPCAPLAASIHLPGTIQSSPSFSIAAALAHSLFGTSPAFSRHVLAASSSWFSSAAAASCLESDVTNASANHSMARSASTNASAADVANADIIALSPAVGLLLHSRDDSTDTESISALQNRVVGIVSELAAHGNGVLSNEQTATARMNQIMSQLAVRGTVRELECVVEAFASTTISSSGRSANMSALVSTWFNTTLQVFCAAVRRSSHVPQSSASAHTPSGRVPLAAAQVGTLLRMLARVDAVRTVSLASASQPLQPRRHITVTATTYEPLLVALAHAGQLDACWTTTQRLLSARESLTPPALTAVMAALYRHGMLTRRL
jgi:hypothetical protein